MKNSFIAWFKNLFARPVKIGWKAEADGTIGVYAKQGKSERLIAKMAETKTEAGKW